MDNFQKTTSYLPMCDETCRRATIVFLIVFLLFYPIHQYYFFGTEYTAWDLLLFSGVATFILGLRLVKTMPQIMEQLLDRLNNRQALQFATVTQQEFLDRIQNRGDRWARVTALISAIIMLLAFTVALITDYNVQTALLSIPEVIGAYIGGTYLGRMACYGQLGRFLRREGVSVNIEPTHVDGVCGLKPVGDYYFKQAMIVAIPAIFLAVWWFLFPIWPRDYCRWEQPYLWLLGPALIIEVLAFILPLWSFHRIMSDKKLEFSTEADKLSIKIQELQNELKMGMDSNNSKLVVAQIDELKERYWAIENMVTWPVDIKTRHRFRFNNILLVMPFFGDIAKRTIEWDQLIKMVVKLNAG